MIVSVAIESAMSAAMTNLDALAPANKNLRSTRSTMAPIGMANRSHGSMTNALIAEIRTGFLVSVTARSGAAAIRTPSAKFEARLAPHMRLKAGPKDFICASLVREAK